MMTLQEYVEEFYYRRDNYKVIDQSDVAEPDLCVIYFSSVGLYSPKNYAARLDADYYEFHRNPVRRAGRLIYVRDVTITFYQDGINAKINSVDRLLGLLRGLTRGFRVITVGISGGGYMAMIAGAALKAEYAISESGMVCLDFAKSYLKNSPWTQKWLPGEKENTPYWNIVPYLKQNPVTIYQFEAYDYQPDRANAECLAQVPTARFFNIGCQAHGSVLDSPAIGAFINLSAAEIEKLWQKQQGKVVSRFWFNRQVLSLSQLLKLYCRKLRKNLLKIKFGRREKLLILFGFTLVNTTSNSQK